MQIKIKQKQVENLKYLWITQKELNYFENYFVFIVNANMNIQWKFQVFRTRDLRCVICPYRILITK
jgi:hypothetical protein